MHDPIRRVRAVPLLCLSSLFAAGSALAANAASPPVPAAPTAAVAPAAAPAPAVRPITHEDLWLMKRPGALAVSPDGRWFVIAVSEPSYEEGQGRSDLWIVPSDGDNQAVIVKVRDEEGS